MTAGPLEIGRLRGFAQAMSDLIARAGADEATILAEGRNLLGEWVGRDDWLPDAFATPDETHYQQYLLHGDLFERFSVVSFVWGPGQKTPIHDHTVWGLVGVLRGKERARNFERDAEGRLALSAEAVMEPGEVCAVSPTIGDIHEVANGLSDRPSISIHCYGGNIGAIERHVFDPDSGAAKRFVSGYASQMTPCLWAPKAPSR
jgi:predicted metal-dependent enzyme (double-stranded beta helix superfamily)